MSIREVLERRRRILLAAGVGGFLVLFLGVQLSVRLHRPWLAYLGAIIFSATAYLNTAWLRYPRCHRSIGFTRDSPRKILPLFGVGEMCPYCGVSSDEPWDKTA
jgi:hypothetical protein